MGKGGYLTVLISGVYEVSWRVEWLEGEKISRLDSEHGYNICSEIIFSIKCIQNIMYWQIYLEFQGRLIWLAGVNTGN